MSMKELPVACCAPLGAPGLSAAQADATARLMKALADPHRVRIVNRLATAGEPVCVCEFIADLGLAQATVSFHLRKLYDAGLLRREQRGTWAYYSLDPQAFETVSQVFQIPETQGAR